MNASAKPKASILIVEDDPAILQGLMDVLVFNGYQPTGVEHGTRGLEACLADRFDLVILDVMLPGTDGFTICRELRKVRPDQAIVMLTAKGAEEDVLSGFKAGADDYVSKPFSIRELMVRIEAVLRRAGLGLDDESVEYRGVTFDGKVLKAFCNDKEENLTRREMDIVSYLHRNMDRIVSKKELLEKVWHYPDADIETRTVDIHVLKLRKKISSLMPEPFILTVRGQGYRLEP